MRDFLIRTLLTAFALWMAELIVPGVWFDFGNLTSWWAKFGVVLLVAVIFGLVNSFIKPIIQILSIPFYILTLGLFHIIVNAFMLEITSWVSRNITHWGLEVDSFFWSAIFGALVISAVGWITAILMPEKVDNLYTS